MPSLRRPLIALIVAAAAACGGSSPAGTTAQGAAPPAAATPRSTPSRVETRTFHSDALGVDKAYRIYLPAGYQPDAGPRWPVLYYLHGLTGDEATWPDAIGLPAAADAAELAAIVVMPDGDDGFYANAVGPVDHDACMATGAGLFSPRQDRARTCVRARAYEDYVVRDLLGHVDATYRTVADRRGRGIAGMSMGGFGALSLAMRHPDLFAAAASHSGVVSMFYTGPHPFVPGQAKLAADVAAIWAGAAGPIAPWVRGIFGPDMATWKAHDPATLAASLEPGRVALYLDCGTEDEFRLQDSAAHLHEILEARGIAHEFYLGPGRHDPAYWRERLPASLAFFARTVAR